MPPAEAPAAQAGAAPLTRLPARQGPNYAMMWPLALAPAIPLLGLAFKRQPRLRNALIAVTGGSVLIYAHATAIGGSSSV